MIIALVVFVGRNVFRLNKEYHIYSYNPIKDFKYNYQNHILELVMRLFF